MSDKINTLDSDQIRTALKKYFGFSEFKINQEAVIKNLLDGNDTFVLMPTGGGKSLCYQLPALMMDGVAVIISPLIALMKNQVDAMRAFSMEEGVAHFLNSSLSRSATLKVREDVMTGKTKLLYFAPESLTKEENVELLRKVRVSFFAIDEAHCISEWGHDFRPEYRRIRPIISEIGQAPLIALTATATPKVQMDIQKNLGMMDAKIFKSSFNRPNLFYEVRPKVNASKEIIRYIKANEGKSGIIYCLSRKKVEELAELLKVNGIKSLPYHAGIDAATRAENQDKFLMEKIDVIVATIAFGMGIDKPDVRYVIHYDIPKSLEGYYQETGRAGRDGGEGHCITFYSNKDIQKLEKFMQGKPVAEQEIGHLLLSETVSYAESTMCRRKNLLHYFGESYDKENCCACDNCMNPTEKLDVQKSAVLFLKVVKIIGEDFKADHIIDILRGKHTTMLKSYNHDGLDIFGEGDDHDVYYWNAVARGVQLAGLVDKDIENYGSLNLNAKGKKFLTEPHELIVSIDRVFEVEDDNEPVRIGTSVADPILYAMLDELRTEISRKMNIPPFVIFQDPSLDDMSIQYPITIQEMQNISGVGAGKAHKFGAKFIELISKYVTENEIVRPQEMVVKTIANKSLNKVYIIQNIDRKIDLEDIAEAKNLTITELFDEIETIVNSGTRINLDYYIYEHIDEDKVDDIMEYFKDEAQSDSLVEAEKELGSEYPPEEIRLVRIKFLSDMGN